MKRFLLFLLLLATSAGLMAAPQGTRPPLSKDDVQDLLVSAAPSKVVISEIKQRGIAFKPTPEILEEFRKAGADKAVLAALGEAYHEEIPNPLGEEEIRMLLAEDVPSEGIVVALLRRGIDFQPTPDYLKELRSEGAQDVLLEALRTAVPRPLSEGELLHLLATRRGQQEWMAQKVRERGIDFEPGNENLQALGDAGARPPLLKTVRTAKRAQPFVPQIAPSRSLAPPHGAGSSLEGPTAAPGKGVTAPIPTYKPDPGYTPEARRDGIEGGATFWIVVDQQGNVTAVREVSKMLGDGLDESAIETLKTWKFNPATRDGVPVPVRVMVDISFRLYKNTR